MSSVLLPLLDRPAASSEPNVDAVPRGRRFRPDIEGLRALAVLGVVLHHAHLGVRGGFLGVDVFLVISGFLITRQLAGASARDDHRPLPVVYGRRIRRVVPVVGLVAVVGFAAAQLSGASPRLTAAAFAELSPLTIGAALWLASTVVLALVQPVPRRRRAALLAFAFATVTAASYVAWTVMKTDPASWSYLSIRSRAWEFALGGLTAVASPLLARLPRVAAELLAAVGLAAVIGSFFAHLDADVLLLGAVVGTALVLAAGVDRARRVERILGEALMQCLGRVAFSWFLWSWPMLVLAPVQVGRPLTAGERGVVVWLSLLVAVASYFAFEARARRVAGTGRGDRPC